MSWQTGFSLYWHRHEQTWWFWQCDIFTNKNDTYKQILTVRSRRRLKVAQQLEAGYPKQPVKRIYTYNLEISPSKDHQKGLYNTQRSF